MNRHLTSKRSKWLFGIALVGIVTGVTVKNVISYPTECMTEEMAYIDPIIITDS